MMVEGPRTEDVVATDEKERDQRRILNFGHTIGHALETYFGFETLRHGEAISYGMLAAGGLSIEYSKFGHQHIFVDSQSI